MSDHNDIADNGALGGEYERPRRLSHRKIEERAIAERWPMKPEYREAIVKRLTGIVVDKEPEVPVDATHETRAAIIGAKAKMRRTAVGAARALIACESQNQADEHKQQPSRVDHTHAVQVYLPHNERNAAELSVAPADSPLALPQIVRTDEDAA